MQKNVQVAIVGGGIGGLTTALALSRQGVNVRVFEQASHFVANAGAGFGFSPNGQICLEYLGVADKMQPYLHRLDHHYLIGENGRTLYQGDQLKLLRDRVGLGLTGALRGDVIDVLQDSLQKDAMQYSKRVVDMRQYKDRVQLTFSDHTSFDCDLVIGADGIHSTIAKLSGLEGHHDHPIYSGENVFYGVIDHLPTEEESNSLRVRPHELFQIYSRGEYLHFPVGSDASDPSDKKLKLVWAQTYKSSAPPQRGEEWSRATILKQYISDYLSNAEHPPNHPIYRMFPLTMKEDVSLNAPSGSSIADINKPEGETSRLLHFGLFYRKPKKVWHAGRVCLLGDACHATLPYAGQGANQAIEDAVVLAQCLDKHDYNPHAAFPEFYSQRFARTKLVVNSAKWMGRLFHAEGVVTAQLRDYLLQYVLKSGMYMKIAEKEIVDNCPVKYTKRPVTK